MSSNKILTEIDHTSLLFSSAAESKLKHLISDSTLLRSKLSEIRSKINEQKLNIEKEQNYFTHSNFLLPQTPVFIQTYLQQMEAEQRQRNPYY